MKIRNANAFKTSVAQFGIGGLGKDFEQLTVTAQNLSLSAQEVQAWDTKARGETLGFKGLWCTLKALRSTIYGYGTMPWRVLGLRLKPIEL